jgi:hypothetical protein
MQNKHNIREESAALSFDHKETENFPLQLHI